MSSICCPLHDCRELTAPLQGGKPPSTKPPRTSAVKLQTSTQSSVLITALKLLLPLVVLAAIFLPKLLKTEST